MARLGWGKIQRRCTVRVLTLAALALTIATTARAQQQATDPAKPKLSQPSSTTTPGAPPADSASATPQFYDSPKFTVSGVTDTTNLGGHGSDTVMRTRESLAKETAKLGESSEATREAAERERGRVRFLISQSPNRAELHHQLAMAYETLGDSLPAVREYQRAAELAPRETYLFDWGAELLLHRAPQPALEVFARGNRQFPKSMRMLLGVGAAQYALGSIDEALAKLRAASDLNPGDEAPFLFVAATNRAEKIPPAAAVEMMQRFVTLNPENAQANYEYAVALWKSRHVTLGESEYNALVTQEETLLNKALQKAPGFAGAYLQLGIVRADRHDFQQAIEDYQSAITISDRDSEETGHFLAGESPDRGSVTQEAHFRLGTAYRQIGEIEKSQTEMKICSDLEAKSAQKAESERHEIQQFVYTLRDQSPPAQ